jgi:hypothetical protein
MPAAFAHVDDGDMRNQRIMQAAHITSCPNDEAY